MNRRQFNTRLAALGLAPLLPSMASARAAAPLSGAAVAHYPWAVHYARVQGACSPTVLANALRIPPELAGELVMKMQVEGVVSAPGLTGIARAVNPINWRIQTAPTAATSTGRTLNNRLRKFLSNADASNTGEAGTQEPDEPPLTKARKTESARSPTDQPTGSAESPPA